MNRTKNSIFCGPSYGSNQSRRGSSNDAPFISSSLFCLSKCECMMIGKRKHGLLFFSFSPNNLGGECVNKPTTLSYQRTPPGGLHRYANRLSPYTFAGDIWQFSASSVPIHKHWKCSYSSSNCYGYDENQFFLHAPTTTPISIDASFDHAGDKIV